MLHFTNHAKDRMKERRISKQEVKECIEDPEVTYPDHDDNNNINYVYTSSTGRRIRVVVNEEDPNHRKVISVMDY